MNPAVQLHVLGPLEVHRDGRPCPISSASQRRLLTVLAIGAGTTMSIEHLIDQIWGEDPPPAARNSLQSHVARLRARIGTDTIRTRPPGYALDLDRVAIDAVAFEAAVSRARPLLDDAPDEAVRTLVAALATWRGAAHGEFAEDVARPDAHRLENLRVDARRLLAEAHLRAGDRPAAVDTLLRLQGEVPLREDVTLAAARVLHAVDRTTEALELLRTYRSRVVDELGLDPGRAVTDAEQQLLRGEAIADGGSGALLPARRSAVPLEQGTELATARPTPPPYAGTDILGRDDELAVVVDALTTHRVVTLVGTGGVGKTRLATVVAQERSHREQGAVAWVDLATVANPTDVAPLLIESLGLTSPDRAAPAAAAAALARFDGLVVLDNCEHVLDTVASVVQSVLAMDRQTRLLATSRERLDVAGEQVVLVQPLAVPSPGAATERDAAVQLFQQRLSATGSAAATAAQAAQVAAAVGGLPLAIELAAARAATLPIDDLLARLSDHLDLLVGSPRRHGERHRTLSSVIAWSYDLLSDRERVVFRRASVFASSFSLADAERICAGAELSPSEVVESVARLVETSMVIRVGAGRYRLLEPLRLFAERQLAAAPDARDTWDRHRDAMLALAERADAELTGPGETAIIAELERALPDLRSAHARALADQDLQTVAQLAGRLYRFAYAQARGDLLAWGARLAEGDVEGVHPDERLRAIAASVPAEVWHNHVDDAVRRTHLYVDHVHDPGIDPWSGLTLTETLGDLHLMRGQLDEAVAVYERGIELARCCEHAGLTAYMLAGLSIVTTFDGDRARAALLAREASELAATVRAPTAVSLAAYALGEALAEDEPDRALEAFATAVDAAAGAGVPFFEAIARTADVALRGRHGDPNEAFRRYRAALAIWSATGADGMAVTALRNLVILLARTGADADALTLQLAVERLAPRRSYGSEADRLQTASQAVRARLSSEDQRQAERDAEAIDDVGEATAFGLEAIRRSTRS